MSVLLIDDFEILDLEVDRALTKVTVRGRSKRLDIDYSETFDEDLTRFLSFLASAATPEEVATWVRGGVNAETWRDALRGRVVGLVHTKPINGPGEPTWRWMRKWDISALKSALKKAP